MEGAQPDHNPGVWLAILSLGLASVPLRKFTPVMLLPS
jgi:hypothetical protein